MIEPNYYYKNRFKKNTRNIVCCNCGKIGHVYKKCYNPITSMGIILYKKDDLKSVKLKTSKKEWQKSLLNTDEIKDTKKFEYLLIRRKDKLMLFRFCKGKV